MDKQYKYQKVASYEGKIDEVKHVLLLYSGGLDTSVMLKWMQDKYGVKITTLTLDIGQQKDDLDAIRKESSAPWSSGGNRSGREKRIC